MIDESIKEAGNNDPRFFLHGNKAAAVAVLQSKAPG
jgi:hypothetical protein